MRTISDIIYDCFNYDDPSSHIMYGNDRTSVKPVNMVIPLTSPVMEIPVMTMDILHKLTDSVVYPEALIVNLGYNGITSHYKSVEGEIKETLTASHKLNQLARITSSKDNAVYYVTKGAIFDHNLCPVLMMSWQVNKLPDIVDRKFKLMRPVLRIAPYIYNAKSDAVQRYIINKIIPACLDVNLRRYHTIKKGMHYGDPTEMYNVKVEIDNCPFKLQTIDSPSVSTTNRDILDVALANMHDFQV